MIYYHTEDDVERAGFNRGIALRLLAFLTPYRRRALGAGFLALGITAMNVVQPVLVKLAIDEGIAGKDFTLLSLLSVAYLATTAGGSLAIGLADLAAWLRWARRCFTISERGSSSGCSRCPWPSSTRETPAR